jgi:hypothetical protein
MVGAGIVQLKVKKSVSTVTVVCGVKRMAGKGVKIRNAN